MTKLEVTIRYIDKELNRVIQPKEVISVNEKRAKEIIKKGYAKRIREVKENKGILNENRKARENWKS